jgi:asparagine synthase (glutamine-hydrolysing)
LSFFCKIADNQDTLGFSLGKNFQNDSIQITYSLDTQIIDNEEYTFIFSGKIFNLDFLKKEFNFKNSYSEVETFYSGFNTASSSFLNAAEGDFSFIYFEKSSRKISIARDHFGAEKAFIAQVSDAVYISSDIIFLIENLTLTINLEAITSYFEFETNNALIRSMTFFNEVSEVLPGHISSIQNNESEPQQQFYSPDVSQYENLSEQEILEEFKSALINAVKNRLTNDTIATNLSGGLDSSAVTSISKMLGAKVNSVYFDSEISETDESYFANKVVEKWQTEHIIVRKTENQLELAKKIITATGLPDQLFLSGTTFVSIAQEIKGKGITKILTGEGGDAVVGYGFEYLDNCIKNKEWDALKAGINGYVENRDLSIYFSDWNTLYLAQKITRFENYFLQNFILECLKNKKFSIAFLVWKNSRKTMNFSGNELIKKIFYGLLIRLFRSQKTATILKSNIQNAALIYASFNPDQTTLSASQNYDFGLCFSVLNFAAAQEQTAIYKVFGIESHHPFFDKNVLAVSLAISSKTKFDNGLLRGSLRKAMEGILPEEVCRRTSKISFAKYAVVQCKELLINAEIIIHKNHKVWQFVDIHTYEKLREKFIKISDQNTIQTRDVFILNRVIYLTLWLDFLDSKNHKI